MRGSYADYAGQLPDDDFLVGAPSPGQRNFPHLPLRPLLAPAGTVPAAAGFSDAAYPAAAEPRSLAPSSTSAHADAGTNPP